MTTSISSRRTAILKSLDTAQRKIDAYPSLCPADALTPADCEVVADLYQQHHDPQAALHWIERGLQLETQGRRGASYRLTELQRSVLHQLHRPEEALALAWHDFQVAPSTFTYKTLMAEAPEGRSHPLAYPSDGSGGAV